MANIIQLEKQELPDECFLFKHSTRCPISSAAAEQVRAAEPELPIYWINVVENRQLSSWVAEQYGVRHESPQLLLLQGGAVKKVWNHGQIKRAALEQAP